MFDYQLIRSSKRKTLTLQIKQGKMFVRAPQRLPLCEIESFINKKSLWLKQKLTEQKLRIQTTQHSAINYSHGSEILYLGEKKYLDIQFKNTNNICISAECIHIDISNRKLKNIHNATDLTVCVKQAIAHFFKKKTEEYLLLKLPELTEKLQLFPHQHKVRFYKRRWGSCNNRAELSFNYLLMMTPLWVIDYVIIHELCHIQHLNHSPAFWQLVEKYQPNYKQAKNWLKDHQTMLMWD